MSKGKTKGWGKFIKNIFKKDVKRSKHFHKTFNAWGFQESIIEQMKQREITAIVLYEEESKTYLLAPLSATEKTIKMDFGHGKQEFIPEKKFDLAQNAEQASDIIKKYNAIKPKQEKLL